MRNQAHVVKRRADAGTDVKYMNVDLALHSLCAPCFSYCLGINLDPDDVYCTGYQLSEDCLSFVMCMKRSVTTMT